MSAFYSFLRRKHDGFFSLRKGGAGRGRGACQCAANRKLYVAFTDFEKAFVSINRNSLWPILLKNGRQRETRCMSYG